MIGPRLRRASAVAIAVVVAAAPVAIAGTDEGVLTGSVRVSPLHVRLDVTEANVSVGETFRAQATVTNLGAIAVRDVVMVLRLDPDGLIVRKDLQREIARITSGKSPLISWEVCASKPGSYMLLAQATVGGATAESAARIVVVTQGGRRSCGRVTTEPR